MKQSDYFEIPFINTSVDDMLEIHGRNGAIGENAQYGRRICVVTAGYGNHEKF